MEKGRETTSIPEKSYNSIWGKLQDLRQQFAHVVFVASLVLSPNSAHAEEADDDHDHNSSGGIAFATGTILEIENDEITVAPLIGAHLDIHAGSFNIGAGASFFFPKSMDGNFKEWGFDSELTVGPVIHVGRFEIAPINLGIGAHKEMHNPWKFHGIGHFEMSCEISEHVSIPFMAEIGVGFDHQSNEPKLGISHAGIKPLGIKFLF